VDCLAGARARVVRTIGGPGDALDLEPAGAVVAGDAQLVTAAAEAEVRRDVDRCVDRGIDRYVGRGVGGAAAVRAPDDQRDHDDPPHGAMLSAQRDLFLPLPLRLWLPLSLPLAGPDLSRDLPLASADARPLLWRSPAAPVASSFSMRSRSAVATERSSPISSRMRRRSSPVEAPVSRSRATSLPRRRSRPSSSRSIMRRSTGIEAGSPITASAST